MSRFTPDWFDRQYRGLLTYWTDLRVPPEIDALVRPGEPQRALDLGCGVGRVSYHLAKRGVRMTAVDFSPLAIDLARRRFAGSAFQAELIVGDVTRLDGVTGPFDFSFDVACFHCLEHDGQRAYAAEVARLLRPGSTHLIWAEDKAPVGLTFSPETVRQVFEPTFELRAAKTSRRRIVASHWYWLTRRA